MKLINSFGSILDFFFLMSPFLKRKIESFSVGVRCKVNKKLTIVKGLWYDTSPYQNLKLLTNYF